MGKKKSGRPVHGIVLLDKPQGLSSNAALQQVKRLFQAQKAGHTGSLDPLATGLLPICLGEATKLSGLLLDADKAYEANCQLGLTTTTGDAEGETLQQRSVPANLTATHIETVLSQFLGSQQQVPPMYSALKQQGQPLYRLARQGQTVERVPRTIHISQLALLDFGSDWLRLRVHCSKGTYIRTLAEDIGEKLGCGAHLTALRRIAVGTYRDMVSLEQLQAVVAVHGLEGLSAWLQPLEAALPHLPAVSLSPAEATALQHGQAVPLAAAEIETGSLVRVFDAEQRLLGLGELREQNILVAKRLLNR